MLQGVVSAARDAESGFDVLRDATVQCTNTLVSVDSVRCVDVEVRCKTSKGEIRGCLWSAGFVLPRDGKNMGDPLLTCALQGLCIDEGGDVHHVAFANDDLFRTLRTRMTSDLRESTHVRGVGGVRPLHRQDLRWLSRMPFRTSMKVWFY